MITGLLLTGMLIFGSQLAIGQCHFIIMETGIYRFDVDLIVPRRNGLYSHLLSFGNMSEPPKSAREIGA